LINYAWPKNIKNVVIKPNMCYYWDYTTGQTTDPKFVAALIDLIREKISPNTEISIVESDASAMKCKYAFKMLGYEKLAQQCNVKLVNLSEDENDIVDVKTGKQLIRLGLPRTIQKADLKISIPKIKYMTQTKISGALKNIFGCNPNPTKFEYHPILDETIVALNKIMKFDLHILDGIIVLGETPRKLDLIMASRDPVALDAIAAKLAGVNPKTVRHIVFAAREGLGNINYIVKGKSLETFVKEYPKKKKTTKLLAFAYKIATKSGLIKT
jgi:uncharacterized protein (DUF362 family)